MVNRNSKPAATAAAPAKAPVLLRAAAMVQAHGLAALPRIAAASQPAAASVARYSKGGGVNALSAAFANATFTLTQLGRQTVAVNGCVGKAGQATAMGLTACALANASNGTGSATGAAIVAAIIGNPQLMAAMLGTKANGAHIVPNSPAAAKWAQGYVNGLCRTQHGLATKA